MLINSTLIYALVFELNEKFQGNKILEIKANSELTEVLFLTKSDSHRQALLFSIHPENYRVEILDQKKFRKLENKYPNKNIFSELLGAKIERVEQIDFDRIIKISCVKSREEVTKFELYAELTGRNSNLILANGSTGKILDCIKKVEPRPSSHRTILPDYPYIPPVPPQKKNPFTVSVSEFKEIIRSNSPSSFAEILTKAFLGVDKLLAEEIWFLASLAEKPAATLKDSELENLARHFQNIFYKIKEHKFHPLVILESENQPSAISVVDLKSVPIINKIKSDSVSDAVSDFFRIKFVHQEKENLKLHLLDVVNSQLNKLEKRAFNLKNEFEQNRYFDRFKKYGDLLTINLDKIPKGQVSVNLVDIFETNAPQIQIQLDPERSPVKNAENYYRKFRKAKTALQIIESRINQTEAEIRTIRELKQQAETASELKDLEKIQEILVKKKLLTKIEAKEKKAQKQKKTLFREFYTSDGWKVLVGKSSKENELLSFKYARPYDFWFHAHTAAGAHVVLVRENRKQQPPNNTIVETAKIAAYYSKAKGSKKVEVLYTEAKFVKKPRKGKTGTAIVERKKTILVEPRLPEIEIIS